MASDSKLPKLELCGIEALKRRQTLEQQLDEAAVKIRLIPQIMEIMQTPSVTANMQRELDEAKAEHARLSALIEVRNSEK